MASAAVLQHVLQEGREKQVMPCMRSVKSACHCGMRQR